MSALDTDTRLLRSLVPDFRPPPPRKPYAPKHLHPEDRETETAVISAVRLAALAGPQQPAPAPVPAPVPEPTADPQMRTLARLMSNLRSARWRP